MKLRGKMIVAFFATTMLVGGAVAQNLQRGSEFLDAGMYGCAKIALQQEVKTTPSAEAYYLLGDTYLMLGDFAAAGESFSKCLSINPEYILGQVGEGKLKLMQKDNAGAEVIFAEAVKKAKKNQAIFNAIAQAYYSNGMFDEAALMLETSFKVKKNNPEAYVIKGDMLFKEKKYNDALLQYQQAIYFDENNKGALLRTARAYAQVNRDVTIQSLDKLESIDYLYTPAHVEAAEYYYSVVNFDDAIIQYEKFVNIPGAPLTDRQNYVASLYFTQQYDKSLEEGEKVLADDPNNFVVRRIRMYNNVEMGNTDLALELAREFFSNKKQTDAYIATDYVVYANMLADSKYKDYSAALEAYKSALALDPKKVEMYKEISAMYDRLEDYENSILNLKEYLAKGNPDAIDFLSFGRTYYQAASKVKSDSVANRAYLNDAEIMFDSVIMENSAHYLGYLWKARAISAMDPGFTEGLAKEAYEVAVVKVAEAEGDHKKELSECYRYFGNYYYNVAKDTPKALEYFNKILEIEPNNNQMREAVKQLSN